MNIFFCEVFKTYTADDTVAALQRMGHMVFRHIYATPPDIHKDGKTTRALIRDMEKEKPDVVMTINFWGVVAEACKERKVIYLAWVYDSPMEIRDTAPMRYETNRIFLFDRTACEGYWRDGFSNVFYMPLAAAIKTEKQLVRRKTMDVSLVGNLYSSVLPELLAGMDDYERGYIEAAFRAQQNIYGGYIIPELLTENVITGVNRAYEKRFAANRKAGTQQVVQGNHGAQALTGAEDRQQSGTQQPLQKSSTTQAQTEDRKQTGRALQITAPELSFTIATELTHRDRLMLLALLSTRFDTGLFTFAISETDRKILFRVSVHPAIDYKTEMPGVFASSRINLNPILRANGNGIPLRVFDVLSCGGFLLSSWRDDFLNYFVPDEEIVLYTSIEEAVEKAEFYMRNDALREKIALAGKERVRKDFTYEARLTEMLDTV